MVPDQRHQLPVIAILPRETLLCRLDSTALPRHRWWLQTTFPGRSSIFQLTEEPEVRRAMADLPTRHLSVRVPWHDTAWDGRICTHPSSNHACIILPNVSENRDAAKESDDRTRSWEGLERGRLPPCVVERAGFLRPFAMQYVRQHRYARPNSPTHGHLEETPLHMPAFAVMATPFRWMMRDEAAKLGQLWALDYDPALEKRADEPLTGKWRPDWVQDHRNQRALLDAFFSAVVPQVSLVLFYVKDLPLVQREEGGPRRMLVGAAIATAKGGEQRWKEREAGHLSALMWERDVAHTLRPLGDGDADDRAHSGWSGGVLLPYRQLLVSTELAGEDLSRFVAAVPDRHVPQFSFSSEHVSHDGAIDAVVELARALREAQPYVSGNLDEQITWCDEQLNRLWRVRGGFPAVGAALSAAGLLHGTLLAHNLLAPKNSDDDPWPIVVEALREAIERRGPWADHVSPETARTVLTLPPERFRLLRLISRMDLTASQADRLFNQEVRTGSRFKASDEDILANPYVAFEADLDATVIDAVGFETVDRAVHPPPDIARKHPLDLDDPPVDPLDGRRVRAALASVLSRAATSEGHTLLPQDELLLRIAERPLEPECRPRGDWIRANAEVLEPVLTRRVTRDAERVAWQLRRYSVTRDLIRHRIGRTVERGKPIDVEADWPAAVTEAIVATGGPREIAEGDHREVEARAEKARALETLATSRFSVLVGKAGTGKTTLLRALADLPTVAGDLLLLAPTGKAKVQLGDKVGVKAQTLAGYLLRQGRWDFDSGLYYVTGEGKTDIGTVVVDEASMITEEMLAALVDAVRCTRLILVGDHRQLPPIGAGRPFHDAVQQCKAAGKSYAELKIVRRQGGGGDDLELAEWFTVEEDSPRDEEVWQRVAAGKGDRRIRMLKWGEEDDLRERLTELLAEPGLLPAAVTPGDETALKESLGAVRQGRFANFDRDDPAHFVDRWQILSPIKHLPGGVVGLNEWVRDTYRPWAVRNATGRGRTQAQPAGPDRATCGDKVLVTRNIRLGGRPVPDGEWFKRRRVENGEIGVLDGPYVKKAHYPKPDKRYLYTSTQREVLFTLWDGLFKGELNDVIRLGYAITVHKAQGSQFGVTLVVLPDPCPLASPELIYTALTRHQECVVLLHQGDIAALRALGDPRMSETAGRLTNLFHDPDPFTIERQDGTRRLLDAQRVHRTDRGELVISKSEVIVANALHAEKIDYVYEKPLDLGDGRGEVLPDFTVEDEATGETWYIEHAGMLDDDRYRDRWEVKLGRYRKAGIVPEEEGGNLVVTSERDGIDSSALRERFRDLFSS